MTQKTAVRLSIALFICALLWGGYTFLVYLGVPVHQLVYLLPDEVKAFDLSCGGGTDIGTLLCRGTSAILPFFSHLFLMLSPFFAYIVISLVALFGVLLWSAYYTGYFRKTVTIAPITLVIAFLLSVWLIGTTFMVGTTYSWNTPDSAKVFDEGGSQQYPRLNRFYEPTEQLYPGSPQALEELKKNYQALLAAGCLSPLTDSQGNELMTQSKSRIYTLSFWCMQGSFFSRAGIQMLMVILFLLNLLVLGRLLMVSVIRPRPVHPLLSLCLSLGVGALAWVAILWLLAVFGILSSTLVRILFFGMPLVLYPQTIAWWKRATAKTLSFEISWNSVQLFLVWLLISYLALNFLNVVRPFPIGWDDLGSYLNRPRLLASYGSFIPSMSQFQWEYLSSLGYLIFGYDSVTGSTFAMQINWTAGLLAVLSAYAFGRIFLGKGRGVLTAMLYYFLPMTGHFSFADMKIDNASFFTSVLAVLAVAVFLFKSDEGDPDAAASRDWKLLLIGGLLMGFSFAIKPTAILSLLLALSLLCGSFFGILGFAAASLGGFGILAKYGPLNPTEIASRAMIALSISPKAFAWIMLLIAALGLGYAMYRRRELLKPFGISIGALLLGMFLSCLPWAINNARINQWWAIGGMLSATDRTSPQVFYQQADEVATYNLDPTTPVRSLPPDLKLNPNDPACQTSAKTEELDRYWGFEKGLTHYFLLPWRQVMNIDAFGYYVTLMPALLLFPLLLLLPYFWTKQGRWLRFLTVGTFVFLVQWTLVANGIIWYGIGMFLGLCLGLEAFVARAPDQPNRWLFSILLACSIAVCLINRLWQFDTQKNIFEYPLGKVSAEALREVTIPDYDDIRQSVVTRHETMTDRPYTYRIGTFISYFIPRNREVFPLADHQLNFFNCVNQEKDHALTLKRLKALGFNSFIFDTNTQTIEKDPNGSLHKKVQAFLDFVNDPTINLSLIINDPGNGIAYILIP